MSKIEFDIKIPKNSTGLRIRHFDAIKKAELLYDTTKSGKIDFVSLLTGLRLHQLRLLTEDQLNKVYNTAVVSFSGFKVNDKPPQEVTLDGKEFVLINPEKVGIGWHMDMESAAKMDMINKDPARLACLFYYPKGSYYGEEDEHENLLHPIADRYETIKEHLMLQTFVECTAFFLTCYGKSMKISMEKEKARRVTEKILAKIPFINGKKV